MTERGVECEQAEYNAPGTEVYDVIKARGQFYQGWVRAWTTPNLASGR
jgi:hypothetical protein